MLGEVFHQEINNTNVSCIPLREQYEECLFNQSNATEFFDSNCEDKGDFWKIFAISQMVVSWLLFIALMYSLNREVPKDDDIRRF